MVIRGLSIEIFWCGGAIKLFPFLDGLVVGEAVPAFGQVRWDYVSAGWAFVALQDAAPWGVFLKFGFDKKGLRKFG